MADRMVRAPVRAASVFLFCTCYWTVHAQTAPAPSGGIGDGDIVVTAQRREQKLQDVGIAITALGPQAIKDLQINNANDLVRAVPTLKMNAYSSASVVFNIRGVSQNDFGDQQEPPVAVYQDDSYASTLNLASFPTFDLARVEVLRGPQGTLFGRNATGGAVQFLSSQPTKYLDGYFTAQTGSYGQIITEGAISGPISDTLQARVAAIRDRDKGYIDNINPGYPSRGANNHWAVRGILAWEPTDAIKSALTVRYMRAPKERQAGLYSVDVTCPNAQFQGEYLDPNTTCAYWQGIGTPGPGTTATGYRNDAITPSRGGDPYKIAETDDNYVDRKIFGATLHTDFDLGGGMSLVSITDYQHSRKAYSEGDGTPDEGNYFYQGSRLSQGSQEFRLLGSFGAHQLVVGAYGMVIDGHYYGGFTTPFDDYVPSVSFSQKTRSFAFFAQDEWSVADKIKLIGGLRYWNDRRKGAYVATEPFSGVGLIFNDKQVAYTSFGVLQPSDGLLVGPSDAKPTFDGITARAEIDYKPDSRTLLYLSYNRGSKSGGFTFSTGTPLVGAEVAALNGTPYRPERLDAIEAGIKTTLLPHITFNLTGFYYFYHDYQAFAQYGLIQTVVNLNARNKGLEADITANPVRGLTLQFSGSLMDSSVEDVPLPDGSTAPHHRLPQAPGFSGTALARYEFAVAGGRASLQADVLHSGSFCFTVLCAPVEQEGSYDVANLRIGYGPEDGKWEVAAFVNNVNDAEYRAYAFDESLIDGTVAGVYAKPRTWGVSGTIRFGGAH